ncbi:hypothetical protein [Marinicauda salina]|nr:hypothetical protein [Marinicauda salina]
MLLAVTLAACAIALAAAPSAAAAPAASPAESEPGRGRVITGSEDYVPLDPIVAAVQADFALKGLLHIEVGLNADSPALRRRIEARMPRLRDAYTAAILSYTGLAYQYGDVPDAEQISAMLQRATDSTLGETGATVLLGMIIIYDNE